MTHDLAFGLNMETINYGEESKFRNWLKTVIESGKITAPPRHGRPQRKTNKIPSLIILRKTDMDSIRSKLNYKVISDPADMGSSTTLS